MKKNVGSTDKTIRIIVALLIAVLYFTGTISGLTAIILGIIALSFIITSMVGFCPVYSLFKITTKEKKIK